MKNNSGQQTHESFSNKWQINKSLAFSETSREGSDIYNWILRRNGFKSSSDFSKWVASKKRILDAGCGNGRVTALLHKCMSKNSQIVGIDLTAADVAKENLSGYQNAEFLEKDLLGDLKSLGKFDLIYCQEVLHHTSNPRVAFKNLASLLDENGEIAIYVYKQKAPMREHADDFVRNQIAGLDYEDAMRHMRQFTELGKRLSELSINLEIPEVDLLGIKKGSYDLQRFVYHFFAKCFWNPCLDYEENAVINYDWYHPVLCSRHTINEVLEWFDEANLKVIHQFEDEYGITVRGFYGGA